MNEPTSTQTTSVENPNSPELQYATFGAGCYWCVEAIFQRVEGVSTVESGFCGGHVETPTYEAVCAGITGHAEVCHIGYDPSKVAFEDLLEIFWKTHDPTTLNRQGHDVGTQYRSAVFYHSPKQKELAETYKKKLDAAGAFEGPIVTEIAAFDKFYKAKADHQNYFNTHPENRYCDMIAGKVEKFKKVFKDKVKKDGAK